MIWRESLGIRIDAAPIALFRVLFGILLFIEVLRYWAYGRVERYYIGPKFFFPFVDGIWTVCEGMYVVFILMGAAALFLAVGYCYRVAAALFFTLYTFTFLLDKAQYNNHYYLICLLGFLFLVTDANRAFSVDAWKRKLSCRIPAWQVYVFRLQIFIVFFYGGIAKLNADWLAGEPVRMWLADRSHYFAIGSLLLQEWFVYLYAYAGLLFDLLIGFVLLWSRGRNFGFVLLVGFNLLNKWFYNIGIFPYLTIATFVLFMDASAIRALLERLPGLELAKRAVSRLRAERWFGSMEYRRGIWVGQESEGRKWMLLACGRARATLIGIFVLLQVVVPLRHFAMPGNVSWTEEGHYFSWRMKLRDKRSHEIRFYTRDSQTGRIRKLSTSRLTRRQRRKMSTRPHMILQYAHYLAERLKRKGSESPAVYARALVSLNGREPRPLIDESTNLAQATYKTLSHNDWIKHL